MLALSIGIARVVTSVTLLIFLEISTTNVATGSTLPAYAHNDYKNSRPLWDALDRGYRGVEVDVFLIGGRLLLGHHPNEAARGESLDERYLRPLARRIADLGSVHGDGRRFLLNIELKERDPAAFEELRRLLTKHAPIFTTTIDGDLRPGPVQVVLVGWHPPVAELLSLPVRRFGIQSRSPDLRISAEKCPAHLCQLISLEFRELSRWNGVGPAPLRFRERMRRFLREREQVPDRLVRVFEVPRSKTIYQELLESGVDYIGTKTIEDTRLLLDRTETNGSRQFQWGRGYRPVVP
jgi:hypothetical protein